MHRTVAPRAAIALALASPTPDDAPVTSTARSASALGSGEPGEPGHRRDQVPAYQRLRGSAAAWSEG